MASTFKGWEYSLDRLADVEVVQLVRQLHPDATCVYSVERDCYLVQSRQPMDILHDYVTFGTAMYLDLDLGYGTTPAEAWVDALDTVTFP